MRAILPKGSLDLGDRNDPAGEDTAAVDGQRSRSRHASRPFAQVNGTFFVVGRDGFEPSTPGRFNGELADEFAGGGVDDAGMEVVDEDDDAGSRVGLADADVMEFAVDAAG